MWTNDKNDQLKVYTYWYRFVKETNQMTNINIWHVLQNILSELFDYKESERYGCELIAAVRRKLKIISYRRRANTEFQNKSTL